MTSSRAAGAQQISRRQQPPQIVHRRIRIRATDGFLQRRQQVVVLIPLPVISHGAALGQHLCILRRQEQPSVPGLGGLIQQLHSVDSLADIPAAPRRQ